MQPYFETQLEALRTIQRFARRLVTENQGTFQFEDLRQLTDAVHDLQRAEEAIRVVAFYTEKEAKRRAKDETIRADDPR